MSLQAAAFIARVALLSYTGISFFRCPVSCDGWHCRVTAAASLHPRPRMGADLGGCSVRGTAIVIGLIVFAMG